MEDVKEMKKQAYALFKQGNKREAFKIYEKLAMNGDADSMFDIADYYSNGWGCRKDLKKAIFWRKKYDDIAYDPNNAYFLAYDIIELYDYDNCSTEEKLELSREILPYAEHATESDDRDVRSDALELVELLEYNIEVYSSRVKWKNRARPVLEFLGEVANNYAQMQSNYDDYDD